MGRKQLHENLQQVARRKTQAELRTAKGRRTEALRDTIDGHLILGKIKAMDAELRTAGRTALDDEGKPYYLTPPVPKARFDAIKESISINFKLLNKVLPDLRTLDINIDFQGMAKDLSDDELRELLRSTDRRDAIDAEFSEVPSGIDDTDPLLR